MPKITVSRNLSLPIVKIALDEAGVQQAAPQPAAPEAYQAETPQTTSESFADFKKMLSAIHVVQQPGFGRKWEVSTNNSPESQSFTLTIHNAVEKLAPGKKAGSENTVLEAKNKKKKSKDWNPNPWAVCHTTVDKDADPEKFEKCVMDVKKKQSSFSKEFLSKMGIKS